MRSSLILPYKTKPRDCSRGFVLYPCVLFYVYFCVPCVLALFLRVGLVYFPSIALYRKVTIWPLVQVLFGQKVVAVMPFVTPCSTAQATALA